MLSQKRDLVFYFTPFYKINAFVVHFNTMASSNKFHVHKQGHYEWRRVQYILCIVYSNHGPLTKLTFL